MTVFVHVSEASRRWAHQLDDSLKRWRERHSLNALPSSSQMAKMSPRDLRNCIDRDFITYNMIVEIKQEIAAICGDINTKISEAKDAAQLDGNYMPANEFRMLERQRQVYGAKYASLEYALAKLKKSERRRRMKTRAFGDFFMDQARQVLDSETFNLILESAKSARAQETET